MKRLITIYILVCFIVTGQIGMSPVQAQELNLPAPGTMVHLSPAFNPPILKGIKVHPDNPFRFDFILDQGDSVIETSAKGGSAFSGKQSFLKEQSTKLIKYFLASLTIPEKDLWVNLSPYEKERIVPQSFGQTEMGRDLLAQDYMLKQITASLIYPEDEVGKKFWKRIYEEAQKKFGTTQIPVNTFNKVWIVPEKAVVYENTQAGTAYVVESKLKVMLEQDYLALDKNTVIPASRLRTGSAFGGKTGIQNKNDVSVIGSQIVREIVIPELTKEVNEGKNFAQLRQVYQSLILATWYKKKIRNSILSQVYADKNKVVGVNISDSQDKEKIYQQYLQAFKKGAYSYIKEEVDSVTQEIKPKKYFSGGVVFSTQIQYVDSAMVSFSNIKRLVLVAAGLMLFQGDLKSHQEERIKPSAYSERAIKHVDMKEVSLEQYFAQINRRMRLNLKSDEMNLSENELRSMYHMFEKTLIGNTNRFSLRSVNDRDWKYPTVRIIPSQKERIRNLLGKFLFDEFEKGYLHFDSRNSVIEYRVFRYGDGGLEEESAKRELTLMKLLIESNYGEVIKEFSIDSIQNLVETFGGSTVDSWLSSTIAFNMRGMSLDILVELAKELGTEQAKDLISNHCWRVIDFLEEHKITTVQQLRVSLNDANKKQKLLSLANLKNLGNEIKNGDRNNVFVREFGQAILHRNFADKVLSAVVNDPFGNNFLSRARELFWQLPSFSDFYHEAKFDDIQMDNVLKIYMMISIRMQRDALGLDERTYRELLKYALVNARFLPEYAGVANSSLAFSFRDFYGVPKTTFLGISAHEVGHLLTVKRGARGEYTGDVHALAVYESYDLLIGMRRFTEFTLYKRHVTLNREVGPASRESHTQARWQIATIAKSFNTAGIAFRYTEFETVLNQSDKNVKEGYFTTSLMKYVREDIVLYLIKIGYIKEQDAHFLRNYEFISTGDDFSERKVLELLIEAKKLRIADKAMHVALENKTLLGVQEGGSNTFVSQGVVTSLRTQGIVEAGQKTGGIDLTPTNMNLQTKNHDTEIKFSLDPAMLQQLRNSSGFVPIIIDIQPMTNLKFFLDNSGQAKVL